MMTVALREFTADGVNIAVIVHDPPAGTSWVALHASAASLLTSKSIAEVPTVVLPTPMPANSRSAAPSLVTVMICGAEVTPT
ncbi:unannotated protein [freshwater metagenome]|uniref:Unannotated protein n=1 Tax=freshwater metagenome TaxID=449393 RepID=A0A6J6YFF2_9ZZZZ